MKLDKKDFLTIEDFSKKEILGMLELTKELKDNQRNGKKDKSLKGKTLGMIFQKSSTRTRVSFEVGIYQLGGIGLFLDSTNTQLGRGEPIRDTAYVLSRYLDGIMIRTFGHEEVIELAKYSSVPIINGLTDLLHPCQALADIFTIFEYFGSKKKLKVAFVGDGNNVANSLGIICSKLGIDFAIASPDGYKLQKTIRKIITNNSEKSGSEFIMTNKPKEAVEGANVIYTDVYASMGQEKESEKRIKAFKSYTVDEKLLSQAKPKCIVLHCLPAHIGEEISEGVLYGKHSAVWDQAENRLHAQKAVMKLLMQD